MKALRGGYVDQVARREQFERDHPGAEIRNCLPVWTGRFTVCGKRREVSRYDLGLLLDELDGLAALAAEATAIERDYPGWHLWLSDLNRWWAVRQGPDARHGKTDRRPMTITADDPAGLRALLAQVHAVRAVNGPVPA